MQEAALLLPMRHAGSAAGAAGHPHAAALSTQNLLCWEEGFEAAVKSQLLSPDL